MFVSIDAANRVEIAEMILTSFCAVVSQQRTDGPMSSIPKAEGGFNNSVPHLRSRFSVPGYTSDAKQRDRARQQFTCESLSLTACQLCVVFPGVRQALRLQGCLFTAENNTLSTAANDHGGM